MKFLNEKTFNGYPIQNSKAFFKDLRLRILHICNNVKKYKDPKPLFAYLSGAISGIMECLNRVCDIDSSKTNFILKKKYKDPKNLEELIQNLCYKTNYIFFSYFELNKENIFPSIKTNNLEEVTPNIIKYFNEMKNFEQKVGC